MNKELQDHVWKHCLPKEFKEEVKYEYNRVATKARKDEYDLGFMHAHEGMFGIHNLTSDAEGDDDEMLCVSRKDMQFYYQYYKTKRESESSAEQKAYYKGRTKVLLDLFGSKCLPEEEPLFSNQPENYNNENPIVASENKPTESTCTDDCPSPCPSQHFDNIINQSFADHNRLHIAAMLAAGMLANEVRCYPIDRALELADKLIKKSKEDGKD